MDEFDDDVGRRFIGVEEGVVICDWVRMHSVRWEVNRLELPKGTVGDVERQLRLSIQETSSPILYLKDLEIT